MTWYRPCVIGYTCSKAFQFLSAIDKVDGMALVTALQLDRVIRIIRVNRIMFCPSKPGLTRYIKYPGLTRILHRITCVNNDILRWWCLEQCEHIMSMHFEKSHCWWRGSTKKSNKIAVWAQVTCTATDLVVLHSQTIWCARHLSVFHHSRAYNSNIDKCRVCHIAWVYARLYLVYKSNCC